MAAFGFVLGPIGAWILGFVDTTDCIALHCIYYIGKLLIDEMDGAFGVTQGVGGNNSVQKDFF